MFYRVQSTEPHSYVRHSNIPPCGWCPTLRLLCHQLMDVGVDPSVGCCEQCCQDTLVWLNKKLSILLGLFGHMVISCFTPWRTISQSGCPLLHSHQQCARTHFPYILTNTHYFYFIYLFFASSYTSEREVISHCGLDLHFPGDE